MQTKKLIETFHSEIHVNYLPIRLQLLLAMLLGNFFCSPGTFLVFDARYSAPKFYLYWLLSASIAMAVFISMHIFNKYLDGKLSWLTDFKPRLIRQVLYGLVLPSLLTVTFAILVFLPLNEEGWRGAMHYMFNQFGFLFLFMFILNLLFMVIYVMRFARFVKDQYLEAQLEKTALREMIVTYEELQLKAETERTDDISDVVSLDSCLKVKYGYEDNYVPLHGIALIKSSADDKRLLTLTGSREYTHNYSLDNLMKVLDHDQYYLMYRRYIVNRSIIQGYKPSANGVLTIDLKDTFAQQEDVLVSRYDAADFKRWFEMSAE